MSEMLTINGVRYRPEDAKRLGLVETKSKEPSRKPAAAPKAAPKADPAPVTTGNAGAKA